MINAIELVEQVVEIGVLVLDNRPGSDVTLFNEIKHYFDSNGGELFYVAFDDNPELMSLHVFEKPRRWSYTTRGSHLIQPLRTDQRYNLLINVQRCIEAGRVT